jgi:protein O-GlcNAc transferase
MLTEDQNVRLQEGVQHQLAKRYEAAASIYERIAAEAPDNYQINHLLGVLRHQQDRPAEALALLLKARNQMPLSSPTLMVLGVVLGALGRRTEAEKALCAAVGLSPHCAEAWANLGSFYAVTGRMEQGIAAFQRAVEIDPVYPNGWTGLGSVLQLFGRAIESIACHTRALELEPGNSKARFGRAQALIACHRCEEALADFDAQLAIRPDHHEARSFRLFLLNYRDDLTREELFAEHLAYGRAVESAHAEPLPHFSALPDPDRRIRVAFLSPDLRGHSVSFFLEPILRELNREEFEIILYHDHFSVDHVSDRLRAGASLWRHFGGMGMSVVEETIRRDAPDVLVDLAGHTGFNRLDLYARRLAPVQINYLGYPNTTGLHAMDYRLTDAVADPVGADRYHTERLIRFAQTAWAYQPPAEAPEPSTVPSLAGAPLTFGSFNALSKVQPGTLRLWRDVLAAVPGSRLILKSSGMEPERWRPRLIEAGFAPASFELLRMTPELSPHLLTYSRIDVALDPGPYNGTTTTCEALWMGVPVVTLGGDRHSARVGASLLTAIGKPEWIARSPEDYVRIAAELARDEDGRRVWRRDARATLLHSPLFDYAGQAGRFGSAVRECWRRYCSACRDEPLPPVSLQTASAA